MAWNEKNFEEAMAPYIDDIYRQVFKNFGIREINRSKTLNQNKTTLYLDRFMAIDTFVHFNDGTMFTFQEKTRRNEYSHYGDFTFEYYNDENAKDEGEWFKLASQLYFYGYANKNNDGYTRYYIIDVPRLRLFLMEKFSVEKLREKHFQENKPPAKASFFTIPFSEIENSKHCIVYKGANE